VKKKTLAMLLALCVTATLFPTYSKAAVMPYFVAINDTVLPFNVETMPFVTGGVYYVPVKVLDSLNIWAIGSDDLEFVRLYGANNRYADFYTARGVTVDQDGNTLQWPFARRVGSRFYVPLHHVCEYFGFTYEIVEIPRDIISEQQVVLVRIMSNAVFNGPTLVGLNRNAIRAAYSDYYSPPSPSPTGPVASPQPTAPPPPDYSEVSIHLSFYNISAGSAGGILDLLDIQAESGFHSCFFVSAPDIAADPGLIRRIYGSGHTIGIWLEEGTHKEFLATSDLLFEAARVKTVIVSASEAAESAIEMASDHSLVFWESAMSLVDYDDASVTDVTDTIPRESGERKNLMFSCSENAASVLPGVYTFLQINEYSVTRITETVEPVEHVTVDS